MRKAITLQNRPGFFGAPCIVRFISQFYVSRLGLRFTIKLRHHDCRRFIRPSNLLSVVTRYSAVREKAPCIRVGVQIRPVLGSEVVTEFTALFLQ